MEWDRRLFKGRQKVWVRVDEEGRLVEEDGLIPMRYSDTDDARVYNAHPRNIAPLNGAEGKKSTSKSSKSKKNGSKKKSFDELVWREPEGPRESSTHPPEDVADEPAPPDGVIEVYTDGACSGNPGPCGYGLLIRDGDDYREIKQYIGIGTNNIAELMAIRVTLEELDGEERQIVIHSDSSYSIGVLTKGWKAKANRELILETREMLKAFDPRPKLVKVKGHSGHPLNERADDLAVESLDHAT